MERLRIINASELRVQVSNEEILDDLLYPSRRDQRRAALRRRPTRLGRRR